MNTPPLPLPILNRSRQRKKGGSLRVWYEGGKKVQGCKRYTIADFQGLLISVLVRQANASERLGAVMVLVKPNPLLKL
ncbi:MAG TPA: hypothetical protein V6C95_05725 [Coleofasciculaceae cyanobacterium]